jgi:hypothetical protein
MKYSVFVSIGSPAIRSHHSFGMACCALPPLLMLMLSLSVAAGQAWPQCGSLSGPSTTWSDANGTWGVAGNWTSGTPNASTNACILDGTSTVTLGTIGNANGLQLASGNILSINTSLSLASGTSLNYGDILNTGMLINAGAITNTGTITVLGSAALINNSGANLTNNGTIGLAGPFGTNNAVFNNNSGANLTNNGTIGGSFSKLSNSGTFINNSAVSLFGDSSFGNGGAFNNNGTITVDSVGFGNGGTFNNNGTISVDSVYDPSEFRNSGTLNNSGTMNVDLAYWESSVFSNSGTLNNSGTMNLSGSSFSSFTPSSNSGTINNSGTLNITIHSDSGDNFTNTGTINNRSGANLNNYGTFNNTSGANLMNAGTINSSGTFTNSGAVTITSSGLFTTNTNYTQTVGSTLVNGTLTATSGAIVNIQGGALGGTGTINGDVVMGGTLTPAALGTPGTLTIFGNYEETGTGMFDELMGPHLHSFLDVSGNVTLDPGSFLDIALLNGDDPLGQTFSIVDFGSRVGEFSNGTSFWDDGYLWDITYYQHEIDVTAVQAPEPSSLLLLFIGLAVLALYAHRKMDKTQRFA